MTERIRALKEKAVEIAGAAQVLTDEPMSAHTTFRIGGPADLFLIPESETQVQELLRACRREEVPAHILGNGSNLLVSDTGVRGAVILIDHNLQEICCEKNEIRAQAGALLVAAAGCAKRAALTGLEFAGGIPGTVGGAVTMNAGAYGGEIRDVLTCVRALDGDLSLKEIPAEKLNLGYRTSAVQTEGLVVLSAVFSLAKGDAEAIAGRMEELRAARAAKQPLQVPSAGSTFKRPEGQYAGKLIMDAGLAGASEGDAQVSEKHCGFVINRGSATAADVLRLIRRVQKEVLSASGVELEPEVRFWGDFSYVS